MTRKTGHFLFVFIFYLFHFVSDSDIMKQNIKMRWVMVRRFVIVLLSLIFLTSVALAEKQEITYERFDYTKASRYPDDYLGTSVIIEGKVVQVVGSKDDGYDFRIATKGSYDNIVYVYTRGSDIPSVRILEDDKVRVKCMMLGEYTYTSALGVPITLPFAYGEEFEILNFNSGSSKKKTSTTKSSNTSQSDEDYTYAVTKKGSNLRAEPSADSEKVASIKQGERLKVIKANYTDGWHQVEYRDQVCFISAKLVDLK